MGQACATDSTVEVAPPPRSRRYTTGMGVEELAPPSPSTEVSSPPRSLKAKKIRSMEHRSISRCEFVERIWYAPTFREFIGLTSASLQSVLAMDVDHAGDRIPDCANMLVTAGEDRSIYVVNYATGHVLTTLSNVHDKDINALQLNRTASTVFSASRDKLIKATNVESGVSQAFQGHALNVTSIHLNPANTTLVSGSRDNSVRLWDAETGKLISTADVKLNVVHFVRWLRDDFDSVVVQGGEDLTVRLWDTRTAVADGESDSAKGGMILSQRSVFSNFDYHPTCVELCPTNSWRVWTGHNGFNAQGSMVTEWDIRTGKQVRQFVGGHSYTIRSIKLLSKAHGSDLLLSASDDMHLSSWNVSPLEATEESGNGPFIERTVVQSPPYREGAITSITEDGDGNILLSTRSHSVIILRTHNGKLGMRHRYVGSPIIP